MREIPKHLLGTIPDLNEYIVTLREAIVKTKNLNDETIADYKAMINDRHSQDEVICFQGIIAGLEEANRNLRICINEVDRRIL